MWNSYLVGTPLSPDQAKGGYRNTEEHRKQHYLKVYRVVTLSVSTENQQNLKTKKPKPNTTCKILV
jgi:hypothetical protein